MIVWIFVYPELEWICFSLNSFPMHFLYQSIYWYCHLLGKNCLETTRNCSLILSRKSFHFKYYVSSCIPWMNVWISAKSNVVFVVDAIPSLSALPQNRISLNKFLLFWNYARQRTRTSLFLKNTARNWIFALPHMQCEDSIAEERMAKHIRLNTFLLIALHMSWILHPSFFPRFIQ